MCHYHYQYSVWISHSDRLEGRARHHAVTPRSANDFTSGESISWGTAGPEGLFKNVAAWQIPISMLQTSKFHYPLKMQA